MVGFRILREIVLGRGFTRRRGGAERRGRVGQYPYFAAYNLVSRHSTIEIGPAEKAGIGSELWTIETLSERTAGYNPPTAWE